MPAPVSPVGHFQWLPAVYYYRQDMRNGGGDPNLALLDDPRNVMPPPPPAAAAVPAPPPQQQDATTAPVSLLRRMVRLAASPARKIVRRVRAAFHVLPLLRHRNRLDAIIQTRLLTSGPGLDVVYLDNIRSHAKAPRRGARIFPLGNPAGPDNQRNFSISVPIRSAPLPNEAMTVYIPAGFLWLWERLWEDLETALAHHQQFVLVLIQPKFAPLSIKDHAYMLATFVSTFQCTKYSYTLDVYLAPKPRRTDRLLDMLEPLLDRVLGASGRRQPILPVNPPADFSALVISVTKRLD
jgi:hypothetical protein